MTSTRSSDSRMASTPSAVVTGLSSVYSVAHSTRRLSMAVSSPVVR